MKNKDVFDQLCEKCCLLEKWTMVSIDKIIKNKNCLRM